MAPAPSPDGPLPAPRPSTRRLWFYRAAAALALLVGVLLFCPHMVQVRDGEGWGRSAVGLRNVGQALLNYYQFKGRLPPAVATAPDGAPLYSWRVLLLPFLEEEPVYQEFHLGEPWDSPHNRALLSKVRCYEPMMGGHDAPGLTRYQVLIGPGTAFERPGLTWDDFPDGRAATLLVVEAAQPVPWSQPIDLPYDPAAPLPLLFCPFAKPKYFLGYETGRTPGFNAFFADGTARFLPASTDEKTLRALATRNGGEPVDLSKLDK